MINHLRREAKKQGVRLQAELLPTDRNRMMYMTYKFANFKEVRTTDELVLFENDLSNIPDFPEYVKIRIENY